MKYLIIAAVFAMMALYSAIIFECFKNPEGNKKI